VITSEKLSSVKLKPVAPSSRMPRSKATPAITTIGARKKSSSSAVGLPMNASTRRRLRAWRRPATGTGTLAASISAPLR
jgi:hypothetical protein